MDNRLLVSRIRKIVETGGQDSNLWADLREVYDLHDWEDAGLTEAMDTAKADLLVARLEEWDAGKQPLPAPDRAVMKRALKAFRKRWKLQILDDESRIGGGPFSKSLKSSVAGIQPPDQYPAEVWAELAIAGRLTDEDEGFYGMGPE